MYTRDEVAYLIELAWAVGVFEGEGSIHGETAKPRMRRMKMEMCDKDVMERFFSIVGEGNLTGPYHSPCRDDNIQPIYYWATSKRSAVINLLQKFRPLLGERRGSKADEALRHYETLD